MAEFKGGKGLKHLRYRYGLTGEDYAEMLEKQGGKCAICGVSAVEKRLHVDHDHACCSHNSSAKTCGECVRGLLCVNCNHGLGFIENTDFVTKAMAYLEGYS